MIKVSDLHCLELNLIRFPTLFAIQPPDLYFRAWSLEIQKDMISNLYIVRFIKQHKYISLSNGTKTHIGENCNTTSWFMFQTLICPGEGVGREVEHLAPDLVKPEKYILAIFENIFLIIYLSHNRSLWPYIRFHFLWKYLEEHFWFFRTILFIPPPKVPNPCWW